VERFAGSSDCSLPHSWPSVGLEPIGLELRQRGLHRVPNETGEPPATSSVESSRFSLSGSLPELIRATSRSMAAMRPIRSASRLSIAGAGDFVGHRRRGDPVAVSACCAASSFPAAWSESSRDLKTCQRPQQVSPEAAVATASTQQTATHLNLPRHAHNALKTPASSTTLGEAETTEME